MNTATIPALIDANNVGEAEVAQLLQRAAEELAKSMPAEDRALCNEAIRLHKLGLTL